ncbi:MAG: 50S ribosomal protein L23 [Archaeoglobi archaeon]|nr:50S ribosomal protein L23 [Candidatus Mnemosynella sp.]
MVIKYPYVTEKSALNAEKNNELQFIVDIRATKSEIKKEVERMFGVKVEKVRTAITPKGEKKAYVKLSSEHSATDLLSRLRLF